jgi:protein-S-isoprenylcysteine O-methyltransferase Ste14
MIEKYLDLDEIRGLQHQFDWANVFTFLGQVTLQANALEDNSLEGILPAKIGMPLLATVMLVPLVYAIYSNPSSMTRREDVKLVKTGAYGIVRHPIYATYAVLQ